MAEPGTRGVALGGFMGVGKSTVGRLLADRLGLPFVDMDQVLARRHGPIADQFQRDGEAAFRAREAALVKELCGGPPIVLATGGGTWMDPSNRQALQERFHTVVLQASLAELRARIGEGADRPLWDDGVEARYHARRSAYARADHVVDTTGLPAVAVVEEVVRWTSSAST